MDSKNIKKEEMEFLFEDDLMPTLEKLGLKDKLLAGEIKCAKCGKVITMENLCSIFEENGEIKITCSDKNCTE
jgi:hypothetical protein